ADLERKEARRELDGNRALLDDPDLREMAREEMPALEKRVADLDEKVRVLLLPKDRNDERDVILEVRAGAGGDEASLFAGELLRLYMRYAERRGWKMSLMDVSDGPSGGIKDATITIAGAGAYSALKYDSRVHRG